MLSVQFAQRFKLRGKPHYMAHGGKNFVDVILKFSTILSLICVLLVKSDGTSGQVAGGLGSRLHKILHSAPPHLPRADRFSTSLSHIDEYLQPLCPKQGLTCGCWEGYMKWQSGDPGLVNLVLTPGTSLFLREYDIKQQIKTS